ncbi:right-handed parallel beta-helix repeat-containing protein, partial [Candidatus Poribacteria bacterium]
MLKKRYLMELFLVFALLILGISTSHGKTEVSGSISSDTLWTKAESPYVVTDNLTVLGGITLTLDLGVVVKLAEYKKMTVSGIINAKGTSSNPIVFTALTDDEYGGDTNDDGDATSPRRGYWDQLYIGNNDSVLDHCVIRYGGRSGSGSSYIHPMLYIGTSLTVSNSIISHAQNEAVYTRVTPTLSGNTITNSPYGVVAYSSSPVLTGNTIKDNTYPVHQRGYSFPVYSGNVIVDNKVQGIAVSGTLTPSDARDETWSDVQGLGLPYVVVENIEIKSPLSLTLDPGAVVKFAEYKKMTVSGIINAKGTSDNPIVFTALTDDEYGGDTNDDRDATSPRRGYWDQLYIGNN